MPDGLIALDGVHGEAGKNLKNRHGVVSRNDARLTRPRGVEQAQAMGAYALELTDSLMVRLDHEQRRVIEIVSSTYRRCEETAVRMMRWIGELAVKLARDVKVNLHVQPNLRGKDLGPLNGMTLAQMAQIIDLRPWYEGKVSRPPEIPGGESNMAFAERLVSAVDTAMHEYGNASVLAFSLSSSAAYGISNYLRHGLAVLDERTPLPYFRTDPGTVEPWRYARRVWAPMSDGFILPDPSIMQPYTDQWQRPSRPYYV